VKIGAPASAVVVAQQAQAQQGRGRQGAPELPDTAAAAAQGAVDRRGPKLSPDTVIQAQTAEKEQDGPGDDVARRISQADKSETEANVQTEEGADGLTPAEERQVQALQRRDAEVRRHEQAHAAAGGAYAGAPQYQYTTGPDGRRYAIGGEVSIDAGAVRGNPEATIAKLRTVKRAALAPANPSPQDRRVAAQADLGIAQARIELREERAEEARSRREETAEAKEGEVSDVAAAGSEDGADGAPAQAGQADGITGRSRVDAPAPDPAGFASARKATPQAAATDGPQGRADSRSEARSGPPGVLLDLVV